MSLVKLSLLLSSSLSFQFGLRHARSPNDEDKVMVTTARERIWRPLGAPCNVIFRGTTWLTAVAESTVIVGTLLDMPRLPGTFLAALGPAEASTLSLPFVFGALLVILGSILRVLSSRALGPYFTFVICIRKDHRLVTSGPYAVVRHPMYTGLLMCILGWGIIYGTPGSWLRTSGVLDFVWVRVPLTCLSFTMMACIVTVFRRLTDEDRLLSHQFGLEWQGWARNVKYQLVPFVY